MLYLAKVALTMKACIIYAAKADTNPMKDEQKDIDDDSNNNNSFNFTVVDDIIKKNGFE